MNSTEKLNVFSENLLKYRKAKKMSGATLASLVGTSQSNISSYETGRTEPSLLMLKRIAEVLNCTSDYLLGIDTNSTNAINIVNGNNSSNNNQQLQQNVNCKDCPHIEKLISIIDKLAERK